MPLDAMPRDRSRQTLWLICFLGLKDRCHACEDPPHILFLSSGGIRSLHVPQPAVGAWIAPRRHRVVTVLRSDDDADSDDDVADNAPIEWDDGQ